MIFNRRNPSARRNANRITVIDVDTEIQGNLDSNGHIHIDGRVTGEIAATEVTVGETGVVDGMIFARTARVAGRFSGTLNAEAVHIGPKASIDGKILHGTIDVEMGAEIIGSMQRREPAPAGNGNPSYVNEDPTGKLSPAYAA